MFEGNPKRRQRTVRMCFTSPLTEEYYVLKGSRVTVNYVNYTWIWSSQNMHTSIMLGNTTYTGHWRQLCREWVRKWVVNGEKYKFTIFHWSYIIIGGNYMWNVLDNEWLIERVWSQNVSLHPETGCRYTYTFINGEVLIQNIILPPQCDWR